MNRTTVWLLKFLRVVFLLLVIAGSLGVLTVGSFILFPAATTGHAVRLNVKQRLPATTESVSPRAATRAGSRGPAPHLVVRAQTGTLVLQEPEASRRLLLRLINAEKGSFPLMLAGLLFSILVAQILRDVKPGVPFTPANVRRLYWLTLLFVGCELYQRVASWWLQQYLRSVTPPGMAELTTNAEFSASLLSNGLIAAMLIILAASYQRGVELTADADLTV